MCPAECVGAPRHPRMCLINPKGLWGLLRAECSIPTRKSVPPTQGPLEWTGRGGSKGLRAHFTRATCPCSPPYGPAGCRIWSRPDQPLAPIGHGRFGAVPLGHLGGIGLDLMLAASAPKRATGRSRGSPERHRWAGLGFHFGSGASVAAMAQDRAFTLSSPAACPRAGAAIPHAPQSIPLLSG
jgi:hypothetical protein